MSFPAVLAIDDSPDILEILELFFEEQDIRIFCTLSVQEGLAVLERENIGFILLDVHMPGITGDVALLSIRQRRPKVQVAIMSGFLDPPLEKQLTDLGACRCFHKPVHLDDVYQEARLALEFHQG